MNTPTCNFAGDRTDAIVEYLYGEADSLSHHAFARHLAACTMCRDEVGALRSVQRTLGAWAPPEPRRALTADTPHGRSAIRLAPPASSNGSRWSSVPVWARAAAAVLCVGLGLGAANLRVNVNQGSVSVQTGWGRVSPQVAADVSASRATALSESSLESLRESLRNELRDEIRASSASASASPPAANPSAVGFVSDATILQKVKTMLTQSEQRQQRDLALRLGELLNDVQAQRRADLARVDRNIGLVQNSTGMEVLRQREMLNSLAVRVSSQR
jgi:hypothetical protein